MKYSFQRVLIEDLEGTKQDIVVGGFTRIKK